MLTIPRGFSKRRKTNDRRRSKSANRFSQTAEVLEQRLVLSAGPLAVGSGVGRVPQVRVYDGPSGNFLYDIFPYSDLLGFQNGVRTAVADVNNDGAFDIITAPGPGVGPRIRVFSGAVPGQMIDEFFAYSPFFLGGVYVAAGDFNRDGASEIVTGAGAGGGPHVRVFGTGGSFDRFVFDPRFLGGVHVATGDVSGDTVPDLIVAAGPGGGPHVRVFNGTNGVQLPTAIGSFFAYSPFFRGGVYVASANFGGTNVAAEVVTGAGEGGGPHVRIIDPFGPDPTNPSFDLNFTTTQFPFNPFFRGGVRVAAAYVDNIDTIADLIVGAGEGDPPNLRVFRGATAVEYYGFLPFDVFATGGIFPASGKFLHEPLRLADQTQAVSQDAEPISTDDIELLAETAIVRLEQAGISTGQRERLTNLEFQVADLPDDLLGLAQPGLVILDRNAGGAGWFVDRTPLADEEFNSEGSAIDTSAENGVDLLTVIFHEFGHHLGLDDIETQGDSNHVMAATLTQGERRVLDARILKTLFAGE